MRLVGEAGSKLARLKETGFPTPGTGRGARDAVNPPGHVGVVFTAWIFYGLAVAAVLVLRRTQPQLERPFCVPGYPWVSLLFCTAAIGLVLSMIIERPVGALIGIGLMPMASSLLFLYQIFQVALLLQSF